MKKKIIQELNIHPIRVRILYMIFFLLIFSIGVGLDYINTESPLSYPSLPFIIQNNIVSPGDTLIYHAELCNSNNRDLHLDFTSWFFRIENTTTYELIKGSTSIAQGCSTIYDIPKTIPDDLPPGNYLLMFSVIVKEDTYNRVFQHSVKTERFQVVE